MATKRHGSPAAPLPLLLDQLERAYRGPSWHGTSLRGTLRGMTPARATAKPKGARNCIWQLLLHAAYWKYVVRRKLTGEARGSFPRQGSDFPAMPAAATKTAWQRDLQLLDEQHEALRTTIAGIDAEDLERQSGSWRLLDYISGAAAHDLYHAGQINLLKRLLQ